jgi:hypothetical protein
MHASHKLSKLFTYQNLTPTAGGVSVTAEAWASDDLWAPQEPRQPRGAF